MFEVYCTSKLAWQLSVIFMTLMRLQRSKDLSKASFENVNLIKYNHFTLMPYLFEFAATNVKKK